MAKTKWLREAEFKDRFDMSDFVAACHRAFELYGKAEVLNPPRRELVEKRKELDYFRLDMPAEWPGKYRARKIIEEYSDVSLGRLDKREAYIELEDLRTGNKLKLEAGFITDMRTGAAGALGIKYLAGMEIKRVGILGTGRIARNLARACDVVFDLDEVRCSSRKEINRTAFAKAVGPELRAPLHMTASLRECLCGVDAVLTAVPTQEPILAAGDLSHVNHIAIIAGDSRTRQVAPDILQQHSVIVDVLEQAQKSGEFRWAAEQNEADRIALVRKEGTVLDMGDAAMGRIDVERSAIYLTGMGAQDLFSAAMIYEELLL